MNCYDADSQVLYHTLENIFENKFNTLYISIDKYLYQLKLIELYDLIEYYISSRNIFHEYSFNMQKGLDKNKLKEFDSFFKFFKIPNVLKDMYDQKIIQDELVAQLLSTTTI